MQKQINLINGDLHKYLNGNRIKLGEELDGKLTEDEILVTRHLIYLTWLHKKPLTTTIPISTRYALDFIGYNESEYMDILITESKFYKTI